MEILAAIGHVRVVFMKVIGTGHVNLGMDDINSRRNASATLVCSSSPTGHDLRPFKVGRWASTIENDLGNETPSKPRSGAKAPCFPVLMDGRNRGSPLHPLLGLSTSKMAILSVHHLVLLPKQIRYNTHDSEKSCQHLEELHDWNPR